MSRQEHRLFFIGRVCRPHGVRGEFKVLEGEGSSGAWRDVGEVFIGRSPEEARRWQVLGVREGGRFALVRLDGIDGPEQAGELVNLNLYVEQDRLPPLQDQEGMYAGELLGLEVRDRQDRRLGELVEIFDNGAHEIYVVRDGRREVLLPAVAGVIVEVDPEAGVLVVDPPPGLPGWPVGEGHGGPR